MYQPARVSVNQRRPLTSSAGGWARAVDQNAQANLLHHLNLSYVCYWNVVLDWLICMSLKQIYYFMCEDGRIFKLLVIYLYLICIVNKQ